ncbi:MAG: isocitrate lyase/phosphoenolpyruvate mutase family protein [Maribacter sp.]|nr:isocitrate lyase/phosphoenolpyruvate mutase family protein [Maribacter sp.]
MKRTELDQKILAKEFLQLHYDEKILLLPNAWDVLSAKIYESMGFKAIGTTSAGIASTLGFPDGEIMSLKENLQVAKRIINNTTLPISVDIEAGYSSTPDGVVETVKSALDIGAIGINLEDSTGDVEKPFFEINEILDKIKGIRKMADTRKIPLVINLRTDVYMLGKGVQHQS